MINTRNNDVPTFSHSQLTPSAEALPAIAEILLIPSFHCEKKLVDTQLVYHFIVYYNDIILTSLQYGKNK